MHASRGGSPTSTPPHPPPPLLRLRSASAGKSGGLTIAEAAVAGVPMVVLDPIPGQETRNADVLLNAGAGVKVNDLPLLSRAGCE